MGLSSPMLDTQDAPLGSGNYDSPETAGLRDQMNTVYPYPPTMPPVFPAYVRSYGPGVGDWNYNVGYKQVFVGNQVVHLFPNHEAPDPWVRHLPYNAQLLGSTVFYDQSQNEPVTPNLRAPAINEGY